MLKSINCFLFMKSAYQPFRIQESSRVYCCCFSYLTIWVAISGLWPPKLRFQIDFWNHSALNDWIIVRVTVTRENIVGLQTMRRGAYYSSHSQSFICSRKCRLQSVCNFFFLGAELRTLWVSPVFYNLRPPGPLSVVHTICVNSSKQFILSINLKHSY